MPEPCRNWVTEPPMRAFDRCSRPALYILWGKLFPPELLGPRCYECAVDQLTEAGYHSHSALQANSGYAIYHIPGCALPMGIHSVASSQTLLDVAEKHGLVGNDSPGT